MMTDQRDDRIALRFGPLEAAGPGDAVLERLEHLSRDRHAAYPTRPRISPKIKFP